MIQTFLPAIAGIIISLGASYGYVYMQTRQTAAAHQAAEGQGADAPAGGHGGLETRKTRVINVPRIAEGKVQGYIVAQFAYSGEAAALKTLTTPPDIYILDEAFKIIYSDDKLDFRHLEKFDLTHLADEVRKRTGERMKSDVIKEVMIQDFNYVSRDDIQK